MDVIWQVARPEKEQVELLQRELGISRLLAGILAGRGLGDPERAAGFLRPRLSDLQDPFQIQGISALIERIIIALHLGEKICIFSDYDVDGLTSNALLHWVLKHLGGMVSSFVPQRHAEGYGLTRDAVERCLTTERPDLLIAVDCGTQAVNVVREVMDQGVDVLIIDHHAGAAGLGEMPSPFFVNPHFSAGDDQPGAGMASVGLCFKVAHALVKRMRATGSRLAHDIDLKAVLPWVAMGTVADLVPLLGENRILVAGGISNWKHAPGAGLQALAEIAGLDGRVVSSDLGFSLGPRINAAGRMSDPRLALELLLTEDRETAQALAERLDLLNRDRKSVEQQVFEEAVGQLNAADLNGLPDFLLVSGPEWHEGVLGIVASRLVRKFHRPCLVVSEGKNGQGKGSARSIPGVDLVSLISSVRDLLTRFGGHPQAAGLSLPVEVIPKVAQQLKSACRELVPEGALARTVSIDAEVDLRTVNDSLLQEMEMLEPCGMAMRRPLFLSRSARLEGPPRRFGNGHLRMNILRDGGLPLDAVAFRMSDRSIYPEMDLVFELEWNRWGGRAKPRMLLRDFRPNDSPFGINGLFDEGEPE